MNYYRLGDGVSIIICCYNSSRVIVETINAICEQNVSDDINFELIIVDNNCDDDTVFKARSAFSHNKAPLTIVKERNQGLIFARKCGASNAKYSIISFLDDDNIVENKWVEKVYHLFKNKPNVGVIGGLNLPLIDGAVPEWFERYQNFFACGPQGDFSGIITHSKKYVFGAGMSFRTKIFLEIFNSDTPFFTVGRKKEKILSGDDEELCLITALQGWDLWYEEDLCLRHKITPDKLNLKFLCALQRSNSEAYVILNMYHNLIARKKVRSLVSIVLLNIKIGIYIIFRTCFYYYFQKRDPFNYHEFCVLLHHFLGLTKSIANNFFKYQLIRKKIILHYNQHHPART